MFERRLTTVEAHIILISPDICGTRSLTDSFITQTNNISCWTQWSGLVGGMWELTQTLRRNCVCWTHISELISSAAATIYIYIYMHYNKLQNNVQSPKIYTLSKMCTELKWCTFSAGDATPEIRNEHTYISFPYVCRDMTEYRI